MLHEEIDISDKKYQIKASLKIPAHKKSKLGIVLAHGGIINRQSLIRRKYSFGEYLCDELDAYVIAPDFQGETIHKNGLSYNNFSEILNITTRHLVESYDLNSVMGFGHSLGCFVLADALSGNEYLDSIVNYGGPVRELYGSKQSNFAFYLIKYLSSYNYSINIKNLIQHIFDKETCIYLENVMLRDDGYCSENYQFEFDSNMFRYFKEIVDVYLSSIKSWGKPALLLFGNNDGVTRKTISYYKDGFIDKNIEVRSVPGASHVTPCMDSIQQLSKLISAVAFFDQCNTILNPEINPLPELNCCQKKN